MLPLTGYSDRLSAQPGERIAFKLSSKACAEAPSAPVMPSESYSAQLIRIISGDPNPAGPGMKEIDLSQVFSQEGRCHYQPVRLGSYAVAPLNSKDADRFLQSKLLAFHCRVWPTLPAEKRQCLFSLWSDRDDTGIVLLIDDGNLCLEVHTSERPVQQIRSPYMLRERNWYDILLNVDLNAHTVSFEQRCHSPTPDDADSGTHHESAADLGPIDTPTHLYVGAREGRDSYDRFNGKIETPSFFSHSIGTIDDVAEASEHRIVAWNFSRDIRTQVVSDDGPHAIHGRLMQLPTRGMIGSNWNGDEHCWRHCPEQYGAIHFHDDDLYDCEWNTDFEFVVPDDLPSGVYAMRVTSESGEDVLPFFVSPARGSSRANIVYLAPTLTYIVYGNHARGNTDESYRARADAWSARPWTPDDHGDYGFSTYNFHRDGSGIGYASRLRPMISMRPGYITFAEEFTGSGLRHYSADTHLLSWLEHEQFEFDVITDEDLHAEGIDLLDGYDVIVTSSHPEYHTPETRRAILDFTDNGGHLMYLGGNGFYWRVAVSDDAPGAVEIRRAETGIRAWAAEPGEYYQAFDGGYGGTWRRNNLPPQQIAGVGFSGQGKFEGSHYRRNPDLDESVGVWVFEGVEDAIIGDFGLSGGGAAGYEVDRVDQRLGTPTHAHVLASSEHHQGHFMLVPEEHLTHLYTWPGESTADIDKLIRADMVYYEKANGGGVFSVGSITWCGSLPHNGYENNIAQITGNVLRRFSTHSSTT